MSAHRGLARPTWAEPRSEYGIQDIEEGCLVGRGSVIIFPGLVRMKAPSRIDSQAYVSVGLEMHRNTVVCPGARLIGGRERRITLKEWSFIGWNSVVMAKSEDYGGLVGVGFGAPGPSVEGDVVFEAFSGLASMSSCFPGVTFPEGAVVGMFSMVHKTGDLKPWWIHKGIPARPWKPRDRNRVLREATKAETKAT